MKYRRLTVITIILILLCGVTASGYEYKNREDFDKIFDNVARNFGAVEYAFYTFGVEFERLPASLQEMYETSHLSVELINPYTGDPLKQTFTKEIGDIAWELEEVDPVVRTTTYYQDLNDPDSRRWMAKTIWIFKHEYLREVIFHDGAPREEQIVRVYCLQFEYAIESFKQRFGHMPESYEELKKGDVNVAYLNPITGEKVRNSETLSPGNFWYTKLDDEYFSIVGWGFTEPVYFFSNDRSIDEFNWDEEPAAD